MKLKHNKRRNTGLLYEFFVRAVGRAVLEGNDATISKAKALLRKHFNPTTDIGRELKLFRVLSESVVSDSSQACHLINRVRDTVGNQSQARLDLEKTGLIHEINSYLGGDRFFSEQVADYKKLATIQVLLNSWRERTLNESILPETLELEGRLAEMMLAPKQQLSQLQKEAVEMTTEDVDKLVVSLLTEKVNEKYRNLNHEQKRMVQLFAFSAEDETAKQQLAETASVLKKRFLSSLAVHRNEFSTDPVLVKKLDEVKEILQTDYAELGVLNEEAVTFFLGLSNLESEVRSK